MTPEERQLRAREEELSTIELPLFILDNSATADKITEWNRTKQTPFTELAVRRDDVRVTVSLTLLNLPIEHSPHCIFRLQRHMTAKKQQCLSQVTN